MHLLMGKHYCRPPEAFDKLGRELGALGAHYVVPESVIQDKPKRRELLKSSAATLCLPCQQRLAYLCARKSQSTHACGQDQTSVAC